VNRCQDPTHRALDGGMDRAGRGIGAQLYRVDPAIPRPNPTLRQPPDPVEQAQPPRGPRGRFFLGGLVKHL
jgi:hypothetical protein